MRHLLNKLPAHLEELLRIGTSAEAWGILLDCAIREKEVHLAGLSTDCTPEKFQRKYLILKAERQQLIDLLDFIKTLNQQ